MDDVWVDHDYPPRPREYEQCTAYELKRVTDLAEKWENATELSSGAPSIVARAFAAELRTVIGD